MICFVGMRCMADGSDLEFAIVVEDDRGEHGMAPDVV